MSIGAASNLFSLFGLSGTTTAGSSGGSSSTRGSLFGPAAQVSLGQGFSVTGLRDYTSLGNAGVPQFDLASVLGAASSAGALQGAAVSPDQQKAEEQAIKTAFEYISQGSLDDARKLINSVLAQNKTNSAAIHALGTVELSAGQYEQAEQLFLKAHAFNPAVGYEFDARNARILQGDDDKVLSTARVMVKSSTQRGEGIRILMNLVGRSPENAAAHMLLGDAMLDEGDGMNGLTQFSAAIREAGPELLGQLEGRLTTIAGEIPDSSYLQLLVGKTQLKQERFELAIQTLAGARTMAQGQVGYDRDLAMAHLGFGREKLGRRDISSAMASFQRAKDLMPTNRDVKMALAEGYVARAEQHGRRSSHSAAIDDYRKAADLLKSTGSGSEKLRERAASGAYSIGRTLENRRIAAGDDIDGEVLAYQVAYDLNSGSSTYKSKLAEARNALGAQFEAEGELKQAAYAYRRAWDLYKNNDTYKQNTVSAFVAWGDDRRYNMNYSDAITAYREAYQIDTSDSVVKDKLGEAYNARGVDHMYWERWTDALADFKEALLLFPDNAEYQANYALVEPWEHED